MLSRHVLDRRLFAAVHESASSGHADRARRCPQLGVRQTSINTALNTIASTASLLLPKLGVPPLVLSPKIHDRTKLSLKYCAATSH